MSPRQPTDADAGRLDVGLRGRMLIRGGTEQDCLLVSVHGLKAHLRAEAPGVAGTTVAAIAYLDLVGRLEGRAVCMPGGDYVLAIEAPEFKQGRLLQQFALIAGLPVGEREELRGHRRIVPDVRDVTVTLPDGRVTQARLRDLSRSGASIEASAPVSVGDKVVVGSMRGRLVRLHDGGFAVAFVRLLPLEAFGPSCRP